MLTAEKLCSKCGITKPIDEFYGNPTHRDGHFNTCKRCENARRRERRRANKAIRRKPGPCAGFHQVRAQTEGCLGRREVMIVWIIALSGAPNRAIAGMLDVEVCTVKSYITHINQVLGTQNRTEIAAWLVRTGYSMARLEF